MVQPNFTNAVTAVRLGKSSVRLRALVAVELPARRPYKSSASVAPGRLIGCRYKVVVAQMEVG